MSLTLTPGMIEQIILAPIYFIKWVSIGTLVVAIGGCVYVGVKDYFSGAGAKKEKAEFSSLPRETRRSHSELDFEICTKC